MPRFEPRRHCTVTFAACLIASVVFLTVYAVPDDSTPAAKPAVGDAAAPVTDHWAFQAPVQPELPDNQDSDWVRNEIDRFVLAKLTSEGLTPSPEADKAGLLRRVTFDLTGMPPTLDELDAFLSDTEPGAYERVVDRLLASPRYGERMAQEWLDLARYADSNGYHHDSERQIWKWRDWVINAYNENKAFDEFTVEQLAGDLLPDATLNQKIATGFNRNHPINTEAGEEKDEYRSVYVIDRANTTATVFMGLTMACAQCHDHKYDPITQSEFFSFYSFFNNVKEKDFQVPLSSSDPVMLAPTQEQKEKLDPVTKEYEDLKKTLESDHETMDAAEEEWAAQTLERHREPIEWTPLRPTGLLSRAGAHLTQSDDTAITAGGPNPVQDAYTFIAQPGVLKITAMRLEILPGEHCEEGASGRSKDGTFSLEEFEVTLTNLSDSGEGKKIRFHKGEADYEGRGRGRRSFFGGGSADGAVDGGRGSWSFREGERYVAHDAIFLPTEPMKLNSASILRITLKHGRSGVYKSTIGKFRISTTDDERITRRMMPVLPESWHVVGPFPGASGDDAFTKVFDPEKDIAAGIDLKKEYDPVEPPKKPQRGSRGKSGGQKPGDAGKGASGKAKGPGAKGPGKDAPKPPKIELGPTGEALVKLVGGFFDNLKKDDAKKSPQKPDKGSPKKSGNPGQQVAGNPGGGNPGQGQGGSRRRGERKPQKLRWVEKPEWRDRGSQRLEGSNSAYYVYRKIDVDRDRDVLFKYNGPVAARFWIDGEEVYVNRKALDEAKKREAAQKGGSKGGSSKGAKPSQGKPGEESGKADSAKSEVAKDDSPAAREKKKLGKGGKFAQGKPGARKPDAKEKPAKPGATEKPALANKPQKPAENVAAAPELPAGIPDGAIPEGVPPELLEGMMNVAEAMFGDFSMFSRGSREQPEFRVPLTKGEHIVVAKIITGSRRSSFGFELIPEGADVVSYQLICDLRAEAEAATEEEAELPDADITEAPAVEESAEAVRAAADTAVEESGNNVGSDGKSELRRRPLEEDGPSGPMFGDRRDVGRTERGDKKDPAAAAPTVAAPAAEPADPRAATPESAEAKEPEKEKEKEPDWKKVPRSTHPEERRKRIRAYFRSKASPEGITLTKKLAEIQKEKSKLERNVPRTMVMNEEEPRETFIFMRGVYNQKGDKVETGVPAILPPLPEGEPANRLTLARWLVSGDHPLTARVTVNRIWQQYFGMGIVDTVDDFGVRGSAPSHPQLLDWLATWFVDNGWDLKALHKQIVMSATYCQSSAVSPGLLERDDRNQLLARGPRQRLNAEMIRDNALSVSGLLVEKIGGKSVKPYQPKGLWQSIGKGRYRQSKGDDLYRRGIYVFWKRGALYPSFATFDAPMRESCTAERVVTNTPLQALVLLNDPTFIEAARKLAERIMEEAGSNDTARLLYAFRLCTSRLPDEGELTILRRALSAQKKIFAEDEESAKKLIAIGESKPKEGIDPKELAIWTSMGNILLNLDATIHRGS